MMCNKASIQSDCTPSVKCRRRRRRRRRSRCTLVKLAIAVAVANPNGKSAAAAAAAFVHQDGGLGSSQFCSSRIHPQNPISARRSATNLRSKSHHFSSSSNDGGGGGNAWSEVFQNAIGSLDRRLGSKDNTEQKRRKSNNASTNYGEDGDDSHIQFVSPLLEDGYPPAVLEYEQSSSSSSSQMRKKPMLLYLPGFDGTILSPFLQFPSLGEEFDVRAMKVSMEDRSTFEELKESVVEYLLRECRDNDNNDNFEQHQQPQPNGGLGALYLMGESFGGILATEVALELNRPAYREYVDLRGLILVNPATSYLRSALYELGPPVANAESGSAQYAFSLLTQLGPLFVDEGLFIKQLIGIISSKGLPTAVNNPQREAYMGRVAFDLPNRLKFMPKDTLKWRLEEWLEWGNGIFEDRLEMLQSARDSTFSTDASSAADAADTYALLKVSQELRTMIIVGELDLTLPSWEEAGRLSTEVFRNARVHVVPGAGHGSTCGASLDLIRLLREAFPEVNVHGGNDNGGWATNASEEELHGLEPRYDGASIGLIPLLYWSKDYYRKWRRE